MSKRIPPILAALATLAVPPAASAHSHKHHHSHAARKHHCYIAARVVHCPSPASAARAAGMAATAEYVGQLGPEPNQDEVNRLLTEACADPGGLSSTEREECAVIHMFDVAQEEEERNYPGS
jgi:hypothetical protein